MSALPASLVGDQHAAIIEAVAPIAAIDVDALHCGAADALGLESAAANVSSSIPSRPSDSDSTVRRFWRSSTPNWQR